MPRLRVSCRKTSWPLVWLLLILLRLEYFAMACSPKAVKSVFIGRAAAQAQHQAKKAKYLAGETKTVGQKLGLSRGGVVMEQIGVDRLRQEIKYLESVEKTIKQAKKDEIRLAAEVAKSQAKGRPLSKWAEQTMATQKAHRMQDLAHVTDTEKAAKRAAEIAAQQAKKKKGFFGRGKSGGPPPPPPPPPPAAARPPPPMVQKINDVEEVTKKRRFFGGRKKTAEPLPPPPAPPPPPPPRPPPPMMPPVEQVEQVTKKKKGFFG